MRHETLQRWFVFTVLILIIVLVAFAYIVFLKPAIQGYVVEKQIQARDLTLNVLIQQVQQQGYAQITLSDGQSLVLVPYVPSAPSQIPSEELDSVLVDTDK